MSGNYVMYQGSKIGEGTLYYFKKLAAAFKSATGLELLITDGYRTYAEQKSLYTRWKAGTFSAPSVAYPGTSLHESGRALDLRDSGSSAGVTVAGNTRSNWMRANAAKYGFNPTGYNFREPWHFELQSQLNPWVAPSTGGTSSSALLDIDGKFGTASTRRLQQVLNTVVDGVISGQSTTNREFHVAISTISYSTNSGSSVVVAIQRKLGVNTDGHLGQVTIKAWQSKLGVTVDGYFGPATAKAVQRALNSGKVF